MKNHFYFTAYSDNSIALLAELGFRNLTNCGNAGNETDVLIIVSIVGRSFWKADTTALNQTIDYAKECYGQPVNNLDTREIVDIKASYMMRIVA